MAVTRSFQISGRTGLRGKGARAGVVRIEQQMLQLREGCIEGQDLALDDFLQYLAQRGGRLWVIPGQERLQELGDNEDCRVRCRDHLVPQACSGRHPVGRLGRAQLSQHRLQCR